jgi:ribosomal protein S18 acetylase RimI-like enzyme
MSITVRHGENAFWGPHVFLEGSGEAEEIREAYARESADWPPLHFAVAEAKPEALDPWQRDSWAETLAAEDTAYFVAEDGGDVVGHATMYADPVDAQALHLASTAVVPAARGRGIGVALATHALAYTAEQGFPRLRTNWRVTNLGASRFWPARGFQLTHIRLVRRLPDL